MKYVESLENDFVEINANIESIIEFYETIMHEESEVKDYFESFLEKTLAGYEEYLYKNNIPLDMVPQNIKVYIKKEKSYVKA